MTKKLPPAIEALKQYTKIDVVDLTQVFADLETESDRAAIVIAGSLVEDGLNSLLRAHLRHPKNRADRDEIWGPQGVLGTFSQRIKMAFAMRLIDQQGRDQLDLLREIRNACAHCMSPLSLKTKELVDACVLFVGTISDLPHPLSKSQREDLRRRTLNACFDLTLVATTAANAKHERDALIHAIASRGKSPPQSNPSDPGRHPNALKHLRPPRSS